MIRIQIESDASSVSSVLIRGHAQAGVFGQDLVCCAVSSIAITAINAIDEMYRDQCLLECEGNRIRIQVQTDSSELQTVLQFVVRQLGFVREQYPDNVKITYKSRKL